MKTESQEVTRHAGPDPASHSRYENAIADRTSFVRNDEVCHPECQTDLCNSGSINVDKLALTPALSHGRGRSIPFLLTYLPTNLLTFKKVATRIIRDLAGVTSGSTRRAGFAFAHTAPYRKFGFTLAEVLITLGIIGVVAALTIPMLVQHYKKNVASSRIKKFVSTVNQALVYAEADLGPRESWVSGELNNSDSSYNFLNTYIKPYVANLGIEKRDLFDLHMATLRFSDGSQMSVKVGSCYDIYYDINGEKPPNQRGRDIFVFILCRRKGDCALRNDNLQAFWCTPNIPRPTHAKLIEGCKHTNDAGYCTLLLEENQYEFPKDYPKHL